MLLFKKSMLYLGAWLLLCFCALAGELTPDGNTVLLDHVNGTTLANNNYPPGTLTFTSSLPDLGQAIDFSTSYNIRYDLVSWYTGTTGAGTIELLINRTMVGFKNVLVLQWYRADYPPGGGGWIGIIRINEAGKLIWWQWGSPAPAPEGLVGNASLPLNEWVHIAVSWGSSGTELYINGELDASTSIRMAPSMQSNVYIYAGDMFGYMDELHISKNQRTENEIADHASELLFQDSTPPEICMTVNPELLWPPNHKMVNIQASVDVVDDTDPNPSWFLQSITSNEPEQGPGNKNYPDIAGHQLGTPDTKFQLRAERLGTGNGRSYTITYQATDASGNSAAAQATVTVPHDLGKPLAYSVDDLPLPDAYALFQNYPNPFNMQTQIRYQLPQAANVKLLIVNLNGESVCSLFIGWQNAGIHELIWNGKDDFEKDVCSGVYFVKMQAAGFSDIKKLTVMK